MTLGTQSSSCLALLLSLALESKHMPAVPLGITSALRSGRRTQCQGCVASLFLFFQKTNAFSEALLGRIPLKYHWLGPFIWPSLSECEQQDKEWGLPTSLVEEGMWERVGNGNRNESIYTVCTSITSKFGRHESLHAIFFALNIEFTAKSKSLDMGLGEFLRCTCHHAKRWGCSGGSPFSHGPMVPVQESAN